DKEKHQPSKVLRGKPTFYRKESYFNPEKGGNLLPDMELGCLFILETSDFARMGTMVSSQLARCLGDLKISTFPEKQNPLSSKPQYQLPAGHIVSTVAEDVRT
ncbi:hypothetical protein HispidOSU_015056, partial [Sigmodon hispidus]